MDEFANPKDRAGRCKPQLHLVPPTLLAYVARVQETGADKYGPYNWRTDKVRATVYVSAALRHLLRYLDGEDSDPESGMPHPAHVAACMAILLDAKEIGQLVDDRPRRGGAPGVLDQLTEQKQKEVNHVGSRRA